MGGNMLRKLVKLFEGSPGLGAADFIERWEIIAGTGGTLTIRPLRPRLYACELDGVLERMRETGVLSAARVCFDLSNVAELVGPWGVHFALLVRFAAESGVAVAVTGLQSQPAALAWIFRASPEVRAMISSNTQNSGQVFAAGSEHLAA